MNDRVNFESILTEGPVVPSIPGRGPVFEPPPIFDPPQTFPPSPIIVPVGGEAPRVDFFTPRSAPTGNPVTINGANFKARDGFDRLPIVRFGGVQAKSLTLLNDGTIIATVPDDALDGRIEVARLDSTVSGVSNDRFIVEPRFRRNPDFGNGQFNPTAGKPAVPSIGFAGDKITIFGTGLAGCTVSFAGGRAPARIGEVTPFFTVFVPDYAVDGPITLSKAGVPDAVSTDRFDVRTPPIILDVSPARGAPGEEVVISGLRFGANNGLVERVNFAGPTPAIKDDPRNTNQMIFTRVPSGAKTGTIRVKRIDEDEVAMSPQMFRIVPAAPSNLSAKADGAAIALAWTDNSDNETGFNIERHNGNKNFVAIASVGVDTTTFRDTTAKSGVVYTYRILAAGVEGQSRPSNEASASVGMPSADPRFTGFAPPAGAPGSMVTLFGSGLDAVVAVRFQASFGQVNASITRQAAESIDVIVPFGAVTGPITLQLRDGRMLTSPVAFVVVVDNALAAPSNLTAVAAGLQINLSWNDNSNNETGFKVERRLGFGDYVVIGMVGANVTTFADQNIVFDAMYTYRVKAVDAMRESAPSNEASASLGGGGVALAAPSGLTARLVTPTQIDLLWNDNSSNEDGFIVERGNALGSGFVQIASVPFNAPRYSDFSAGAGNIVTYRVKAFNATQQSAYSNVVKVGGPLPPVEFTPNAPSGLVANAGTTSIRLDWLDNSAVETAFVVERRLDTGAYATIAALGANSTSHVDASVAPGVRYVYRVRARNGNGDSDPSNEASAMLVSGGGGGTVPNAPTNLSATPELNAIGIAWADNSGDETAFKVERQINAGDWALIATLPANMRSFFDSPLSSFNTYSYRVRASNAAGDSANSNVVSARPLRFVVPV